MYLWSSKSKRLKKLDFRMPHWQSIYLEKIKYILCGQQSGSDALWIKTDSLMSWLKKKDPSEIREYSAIHNSVVSYFRKNYSLLIASQAIYQKTAFASNSSTSLLRFFSLLLLNNFFYCHFLHLRDTISTVSSACLSSIALFACFVFFL